MQYQNNFIRDQWKPYALVAAVSLLLFLPFLGSTGLFDWDEINFAESAREMLMTGNYGQVTVNYDVFWEKPPLFMWLQSISFGILGVSEFAARLPNVLVGLTTLLLIFFIGKKTHNASMGSLWVALYLASVTPQLYFHTGIIDPLFNLFIFLTIWQLYLTTQSGGMKNWLFAGLFLGAAVLTKGPAALAIVGITGGVYWLQQKLKPWFNLTQLAVFIIVGSAVASLWFVPELLKNGPGFLKNFLTYQFDLFKNPVASHGQPWYYHFVVLAVGCVPASAIMIPTMLRSVDRQNDIFSLWMKTLFWVVLILFSLATTKIVHYSSMCYLPLTFLAAKTLISHKYGKVTTISTGFLLFIWFLLLLLLPILGLNSKQLATLYPKLISDTSAKAMLLLDGGWSWFHFIPAAVFGVGGIFLLKGMYNKHIRFINLGLGALSVNILLMLALFAPAIENHTQKDIVQYYKGLKGADCYVDVLGFKSYAHYFYTEIQPLATTDGLYVINKRILDSMGVERQIDLSEADRLSFNYHQMQWLKYGDVDKDVYLICQLKKVPELERISDFKKVYQKGGYVAFMRRL